jgi:hypothetical protein
VSTRYTSSIESRARRLASKVRRALEIQKEDRVLQSSLTLTEMMNGAVYQLRPNGPLPSDGLGLER